MSGVRAITIRQPWASLIAIGVKTIETRSWPAPAAAIGQRLVIHAGTKRPPTQWVTADQDPPPAIDLVAMSRYWDWAESVNDHSGSGAYRWVGPLGAIVASATLADCVPMVACGEEGAIRTLDIDDDGSLWLVEPQTDEQAEAGDELDQVDVSDQLPFGRWEPGRWAWLLDDVEQCDPIPAKGRLGLWRWEP